MSKERRDDYKRYIDWIKSSVRKLQEVKPDYIFLTESSGTLCGWVLKSAWKKAYPLDEVPKFYRIDPKVLGGAADTWHPKSKYYPSEKSIAAYFSRRIKKDGATAIVFDESGKAGLLPRKIGEKAFHRPNNAESVHRAAEFLLDCDKIKNIYTFQGGEGYLSGIKPLPGEDPEKFKVSYIPTSRKFSHNQGPSSVMMVHRPTTYDEDMITEKEMERYRIEEDENPSGNILVGRIVKHPVQRKRALAYIKEQKRIGREAGKELRQELEHQKSLDLESKLTSIIAISSLAVSIFFLSSNLTGFVVGGLNQTSLNWTGGVLFMVGLVVAGLYFKRR